MEALYISLLCLFASFVYLLFHHKLTTNSKPSGAGDGTSFVLPPGKTGWPLIGETLEFVSTGWKGHPEKFVEERMEKYSSDVFKTHLLGEPFAVFCGPSGNKFLFSNEGKLVRSWWPPSLHKIISISDEETAHMMKALHYFIKASALQGYVETMDKLTQRHFAENWEQKGEDGQVVVLPLAKEYTFLLSCKLFMSIDDPLQIARFSEPFDDIVTGMFSIPVNLPGTPMNKAIKATVLVRDEIISIVRHRKFDLAVGKASPTQDILSYMLSNGASSEKNVELSEASIASSIISLLIAAYESTSVTCTFIVKYLAEFPEICEAVRKEQFEIAKSKAPGELLTWEDIQKMKYSWNVAREVLRITPPVQGTFREAIVDFTYKGYTIPKGWKLYWSAYSTHKNHEFFEEPKKFDPSRFEGSGPAPYTFVPFAGGPKMCPGREYARFQILIFMHHLTKKFKWEKMILDEEIVVKTTPFPAKGLPIRLFPHKA